VVHQTDADTSASSLNSYSQPGANGAHFLIDKDGTIYQTAAIYQRTNHVGPLKARCLVIPTCKMSDFPPRVGPAEMHRIEMLKAPADRYPSNMEAIGIEMVGRAKMPEGFKPTIKQRTMPLDQLRGEASVFPAPTAAQNQALSWLVHVLQNSMRIPTSEVFLHPEISRKNSSEAQGANWTLSVPTP